ncbi:Rie1 protein [Saccharomycopsis crataegensis]|uniref:Rie1 protein n=1 Tax=Saccharomycopsis crataegensis TaxID=43959 RepID=A0AAV5QRB0_9ASCO|nr:Rie1 protein [Saccharomycopsis crataegensis]
MSTKSPFFPNNNPITDTNQTSPVLITVQAQDKPTLDKLHSLVNCDGNDKVSLVENDPTSFTIRYENQELAESVDCKLSTVITSENLDASVSLVYDTLSHPGNIYVKGLHPTTSTTDLHKLFTSFGTLVACKIVTDPSTGVSKGFGFVNFANGSAAKSAIAKLNGTEWKNQTLYLNRHISKKERLARLKLEQENFKNLYVKNLPLDVTEEQILELFRPFGEIDSYFLPKVGDDEGESELRKEEKKDEGEGEGKEKKQEDSHPIDTPNSDNLRGYGFIKFTDHQAAIDALSKLNDFDFHNHRLQISRAQRREERNMQDRHHHNHRHHHHHEYNHHQKPSNHKSGSGNGYGSRRDSGYGFQNFFNYGGYYPGQRNLGYQNYGNPMFANNNKINQTGLNNNKNSNNNGFFGYQNRNNMFPPPSMVPVDPMMMVPSPFINNSGFGNGHLNRSNNCQTGVVDPLQSPNGFIPPITQKQHLANGYYKLNYHNRNSSVGSNYDSTPEMEKFNDHSHQPPFPMMDYNMMNYNAMMMMSMMHPMMYPGGGERGMMYNDPDTYPGQLLNNNEALYSDRSDSNESGSRFGYEDNTTPNSPTTIPTRASVGLDHGYYNEYHDDIDISRLDSSSSKSSPGVGDSKMYHQINAAEIAKSSGKGNTNHNGHHNNNYYYNNINNNITHNSNGLNNYPSEMSGGRNGYGGYTLYGGGNKNYYSNHGNFSKNKQKQGDITKHDSKLDKAKRSEDVNEEEINESQVNAILSNLPASLASIDPGDRIKRLELVLSFLHPKTVKEIKRYAAEQAETGNGILLKKIQAITDDSEWKNLAILVFEDYRSQKLVDSKEITREIDIEIVREWETHDDELVKNLRMAIEKW